ncbi:MAG: PD-(D/E)XK nuclease family protein [Aestuariivita sp.]|nr:PD-(D/E)XK nuclease family protein [Aestuariivita sp.]
MIERPNLFCYATSELSQDAFLCWLIKWADTEYAKIDPVLHRTGMEFLKSIGRECEPNPFKGGKEALSVKIEKQYKGKKHNGIIDILAHIFIGNRKYVLVIEDKTRSTVDGDQLSRYREIVEEDFKCYDNRFCVYLKTREILPAARHKAESNKFLVYSRNDLLKVLEPSAKETKNSIFRDYYLHLRRIDRECKKFRTKCTEKWINDRLAWEGFLGALFEEMRVRNRPKDWFFVNNGSGGEFIFDLVGHRIESLELTVGLSIVKKWNNDKRKRRCFLAFKVGPVSKETGRSSVRNKLYGILMEQAKESEGWYGKVKKPNRFGNGEWMVFGEIDQKYWFENDADGRLNMNGTIESLDKAKTLFEAIEYR